MTQEELIRLILTQETGQVLVAEADAGSGKTHAVMIAVAQLPESATVFVAAPTHIAKEELESKLQPNTKCKVIFGTSASLAGRYLHLNRDNGKIENRFAPKSISYDLIVMDEVAATPACDITRVLHGNSPVVMLGDRAQLDAVRSRVADVWTDGWQNYTHRSFTYVGLEGQHRSTGSLYNFQRSARDKAPNWTRSFDGGRMFYTVAEFEEDFVQQLAEAYNSGKDLRQYCLIAYKNSTVNRIQSELRQKVFGLDNLAKGFATGEIVRCESVDNVPVGRFAEVLETISANDVVVAGEIVKSCKVHLLMPDNTEKYVVAIHPMFLESYKLLLESCRESRSWDKFFALENHFSILVNANVMTGHKCQGRSIQNVWAHVDDLGSRKKLIYVAYSRASKTLTGVWPTEKHGIPKKYFAGLTLDQLNAERQTFAH